MENQNSFRLRGQSATLAGKPDLLVLQRDRVLIVDVKSGREQPWHHYQVMIYMYALPRALPEYQDTKFSGEIIYNDHTNRVPQGGIDQARLYAKFRGSNGCHHVGTPPLMAGVGGFFTIRCQR